ncbi:hypothetical protein K449DRAFT_390233 [Hypoxylon sp. EC38]|nr:hypothetical protein K449DRAFT_390233 [Hypoxylon sp. EC38]
MNEEDDISCYTATTQQRPNAAILGSYSSFAFGHTALSVLPNSYKNHTSYLRKKGDW